jgi:hypothetical protein
MATGQIGVRQWFAGMGSVGLALLGLGFGAQPSPAQTACEPPEPGEYLLLIVSETAEKRAIARDALPDDIESEVCRYIDDVVTRVGGFEDLLIAEDWAAYFEDTAGLSVYVIEPDAVAAPRPPARRVVRRSPPSSRYDPEPLGSGYAVLVDYFNRPEIAAQVERAIGKRIALVSYGQRPYLLVEYGPEADDIIDTFETLNDRGFWPLVVDSSRVTILRSGLVLGD